ncbi:hypothetical protein AK812_SmicGene47407 [Symbiodinium microadriaticum]|uniref:Uncharacterized protein n=1 Tax=Symbiodinium microadriaticum TaxID=2951 RepID=A0A1Q9BRP5_SYMMI|nr:hypothetical protein AK812_SmicGene47407 [Symbiodinium microadriaticum]
MTRSRQGVEAEAGEGGEAGEAGEVGEEDEEDEEAHDEQEELEIKAFIHEYNRAATSSYKLMAYWTRPAFGLLDTNGSQVAYIAAAKADLQSLWLPMKQLALDLLEGGLDFDHAYSKFEAAKKPMMILPHLQLTLR